VPNDEDADIDGDGIPNDEDDDIDGDGIPNDEDDDIDGDGVPNDEDDDEGSDSAVLARDRTPAAGDLGGGGSDGSDSASGSGDGFPWWVLFPISAVVLIGGAGATVFVLVRTNGRIGW
jgi:hypothetical protein